MSSSDQIIYDVTKRIKTKLTVAQPVFQHLCCRNCGTPMTLIKHITGVREDWYCYMCPECSNEVSLHERYPKLTYVDTGIDWEE